MDNQKVLELATTVILRLKGRSLDILTVKKPQDMPSAIGLSKVISKLSPIIGNTLESALVQELNTYKVWPDGCIWIRQDPDFPDILLSGTLPPRPGMEVKAWFPLATEITARFRDSQSLLREYNTKVVIVCWLPEFVIAGKPKIIDILVADAIDFAKARDTHYHNPPNYLVVEPEDTSLRTRNLQQKNCNGLRFQGTTNQLLDAQAIVSSWGVEGKIYRTELSYQLLLRELTSRFPYRLDTNFAKIDRIALESLEAFKQKVLHTVYFDRTIQAWITAISISDPTALVSLIESNASFRIE